MFELVIWVWVVAHWIVCCLSIIVGCSLVIVLFGCGCFFCGFCLGFNCLCLVGLLLVV